MKLFLYFLFLIPISLQAKVPIPNASTGFEAGVARLSDGDKSLIGTSWAYHFDFRPDEFVSFFGQAGVSSGKDDEVRMTQKAFSGGLRLYPLPILAFRFGLATTVSEIEEVKTQRKNELGPLVGADMIIPFGVFSLGTSATVIRTESMHTSALRAFVLISF